MARKLPVTGAVTDTLGRLAPRVAGALLAAPFVVGSVAAQGGGGGCPMPAQAATGLSTTVQQGVGILILILIIVAGIAEGLARTKRDPNEEADMKEWRNGAALGVFTVPLLLWFILNAAGNFGITIAQCVDLIPFF